MADQADTQGDTIRAWPTHREIEESVAASVMGGETFHQRVSILLAAWEECHRDLSVMRERVTQLTEAIKAEIARNPLTTGRRLREAFAVSEEGCERHKGDPHPLCVPCMEAESEEQACAHGCGFNATVQHADGRMLCISCYRAEVDQERGLESCPTCYREDRGLPPTVGDQQP